MITAFTTFPFCTWPSGAASFTLAVITSPRPAFNPVDPPSGRIICSFRAPELSATSSMLLIITAIIKSPCAPAAPLLNVGNDGLRHQCCAAHNILQTPPLQLGQGPGFFQADDISYPRFVLFVVRIKLLGLGDDAAIEGMRLFAHHFHHDGLLHAVGHYLAHHQFAATGIFGSLALLCFRVCHYFFSVVTPPGVPRSRAMVFTRAMSRRRPRIFFRLSVCPMLS